MVEGISNMSCSIRNEEREGKLLAYCAGKLGANAAAEYSLHLKSCAECARNCAAQTSVWQAMDSWQAAPVSPEFDRRLFARIEAEKAAPWWHRELNRVSAAIGDFLRPVLAQPAFPLSAAALVIAVGFVLDHPANPHAPAAHATVRSTGLEVEKVEASLDDMDMLRQFDSGADEKENTAKSM
jgi:anti-sigma factor RsiW